MHEEGGMRRYHRREVKRLSRKRRERCKDLDAEGWRKEGREEGADEVC